MVRAARAEDARALYEMAKLTGGGFTNLPPDRAALAAKLALSAEAFAREGDGPADEQFVLVLENAATGEVRGTCQLFTQVGRRHPFYSYRRETLTRHSRELARDFAAEVLTLTTDLEGSSEVGGLFLHPAERAGGLGLLLARSRYLFIAEHRARFADRLLAELRGVIDEAGGSPFWDGLAGRFLGMGFQDADEVNAVHGRHLLSDLMPRHPIYAAMLPDGARHAAGLPHPSGRAAMRMLEIEGFRHEQYLDIFDGGPTMTARTDEVRSIRAARSGRVAAANAAGGAEALVSTGRLAAFRCTYAEVGDGEGGPALSAASAELLGARDGDAVRWVGRP